MIFIPKCPAILKGLRDYEGLTAPLQGVSLPKSKKVFDNSKVTDHHAIIPTGVYAQNLTDMERRVYDLIARRFIAVFYPDCKISTTTVMGDVDGIEFKVTGKQIIEPGWRVVFAKDVKESSDDKEEDNENVLPPFVKGEKRSACAGSEREMDAAAPAVYGGYAVAGHGDSG